VTQQNLPHFTVTEAPLVPFDLGDGISGEHAILYHSADKTRLAGSFKESGVMSEVMPFDEFIYVVTGSTTITVGDDEPVRLEAGSCCYLRQGLEVTFDHSDDFQDVVVLISDGQPIEL
jgi:uncharacterized cupin superfamily protein